MKKVIHLYTLLLLLLVTLTLVSCDETIKLDLKQTKSKVVIEGLVTDQPGMQYVKLTRTADFYANGSTPRIKDGIVTITDDQNNTFTLVHNPDNKPSMEGIYIPQPDFTGVIGRTYTLNVVVGSETFTASDKLFPVSSIDSVEFKLDADEKKDPQKAGKFYKSMVYAKEPKPSVDYYLFKFYRNDTLIFDDDSDIYYSDDSNIAENIDGVEGPNYYAVGDTARVQFYSLSRNGFVYYNDLSILLTNSGGIFDSPPANARTNLSNNALGFFQVSAVTEAAAILKEAPKP